MGQRQPLNRSASEAQSLMDAGVELERVTLGPKAGDFQRLVSGRMMMIRACPPLIIATVVRNAVTTQVLGHAV
jgi:hypothetical protein